MTIVSPELCDLWNLLSSDLIAAIRGVAGSAGGGGLPGLAPSDQQVFLGPAWSSSVDSVLPGRSWPWWRCFLPAARPSQFRCLLENIRSLLQRGSVADQGRAGALSTSSLTWLTLETLSQVTQSNLTTPPPPTLLTLQTLCLV